MTEHTQHTHHHGGETGVSTQQSSHTDHTDHTEHPMDHDSHTQHEEHDSHGGHGSHAGHEKMFRDRFWVSLLLSLPVLFFSPALQSWLGYAAPSFPGSTWITPVLAVVIFIYGGLPFLQMATWELRDRQPGMMTLI